MAFKKLDRADRFVVVAILAWVSASGWSGSAYAGGSVTGHGRIERIKGRPSAGYYELYECNLFLSCPGASPVGPSRRLGADPSGNTHDGYYRIDNMPIGTYSILVNQPLFFVRPKVVSNVVIESGQTLTQNVDLPIDYSTLFRDAGQWTLYDNPWYQTFTATGTSVTGVDFVLAGTNATAAEVSVLESNGDADVRNWRVLGTRTANTMTANNDNWVRWRSGEIPMVPGRQYAVRVTGTAGGDGRFAPYKRNKGTDSYVGGRAYNSAGVPQTFDLNYIVFADNDGTRVTMNKRTLGPGALLEGNYGQRWGQTFIARGKYFAAADVWAAGADHVWDLDFTWRVRRGGPGGPQVGVTKTTKAAYQSFGCGLHGVSYSNGEVPLVPGETYFVEFSNYAPGFNPYVMDNDDFAEGIAYQDNVPRPDIDLSMTILEYVSDPAQPYITRQPASITRDIKVGENPENDSFTIQNTWSGTLNYAITDTAAWLSEEPASGTSTGETDTIAIRYATASLLPGTYTAAITISDPNAFNNPQTITVTVRVVAGRGDFDGDGDVDMTDFSLFQMCFNGPNVSPGANCWINADLDLDGDVDHGDLVAFQACFNGPNQPSACP